jgi:hypothetical protein
MKDIKLWIRRWIWETDADWEEKSSQRRNLIPIQYQFGTVTTANTGFGKKQLDYSKTHGTYGERFVDSRTVWEPNS